jgi:hypothetical protein
MFQAVSSVVGTSLMMLLIDILTALGTPRPQAIFAVSLVGVAYLVSQAMLVAIGERLLSVTLAAAVLVAMPLSLAPVSVEGRWYHTRFGLVDRIVTVMSDRWLDPVFTRGEPRRLHNPRHPQHREIFKSSN